MGRRWTQGQDRRLAELVGRLWTARAIARVLGRTAVAVQNRRRKLGLKGAHGQVARRDLWERKVLPRLPAPPWSIHQCVFWPGAKDTKGYGQIRHNNKNIIVSRLALEVALGRELMPGECACHRCDNPACCNPFHIFVGSHSDNMKDAQAKGRMRGQFVRGHNAPVARGECCGNAVLTEADVREMRSRHATLGHGSRKLSKAFGVSRATAQAVINRKTWRHVI